MQRLSDTDLLALLDELESDRVERKESFRGDVPKKARQAVCAFANDLSAHNSLSVLFIGARDDGSPSRIEITDQLLLSLADMKTDGNILPLPVLTVEKRNLKDAEMAVVTVFPSDTPPVKYEGRIWVRTGPRRSIASAQEERILNEKRRYRSLSFDIYPIPTAKISNLSRSIFENEYLPNAFSEYDPEEDSRSYAEKLASCKMIVSPEDTTPTLLGLLAIGISPQDYLPGAYIQFLRIDGNELSDPVIDEEAITGGIPEMLRRAEEKLRSHNRISVNIVSSSTHQTDSPYPQVALQQILYNALFHRTYEGTNTPVRVYWFNDRIEINSPGGPYGNVTEDNFAKPGITDYRNPNIASVLKAFGFVQAFGRGIATAQKHMLANGNPELVFEVNQSAVVCILRGKQ